MPFIKIYIHLVFSTLDRKPLLDSSDVRIKLWKHIKQNATEKGIFIDMINGYSDHCPVSYTHLTLPTNREV